MVGVVIFFQKMLSSCRVNSFQEKHSLTVTKIVLRLSRKISFAKKSIRPARWEKMQVLSIVVAKSIFREGLQKLKDMAKAGWLNKELLNLQLVFRNPINNNSRFLTWTSQKTFFLYMLANKFDFPYFETIDLLVKFQIKKYWSILNVHEKK